MSGADSVYSYFAEPENQRKLRRCIDSAIAIIEARTAVRVPFTEAERRNAFAQWLAEGNVLSTRSITRNELLQDLHDRRPPAATAANG